MLKRRLRTDMQTAQTVQAGLFFNLDLYFFRNFYSLLLNNTQQLGTGFSKHLMSGSKKFSEQLRRKDNSLLEVFHICLPGDSKVHFGSAVYEMSVLQHTMNSLC